jgi:hypothetical protein
MIQKIGYAAAAIALFVGVVLGQTHTAFAAAAPQITSENHVTVAYNSPFSFTITTTGDPVPTITKRGKLPPGTTFTDNLDGTATLAGTPTGIASGPYGMEIKAKNTAGVSLQDFTLTITRAPHIKNIPRASTVVLPGEPFLLTIGTLGYPIPSLALSGDLPAGLTFSDNSEGVATIQGVTEAPLGTYPLTITATSLEGVATKNFKLRLYTLPVFHPDSPSQIIANEGYQTTRDYMASGFPTPTLSLNGTLPTGLVFYPETGRLDGLVAAGTSGSYPIAVVATNGAGSVTLNVQLTVVDTPPQ